MAEFQRALQDLSGTKLDAQGAANAWAGTTGLGLLGALNAKAGTKGLGLGAVVRAITGGTGEPGPELAAYAAGGGGGEPPPATAPGAPTGVSAVRGNAQATVSFTAPASNGGAAITGYTVTSSPGGLTGTGASGPITVTGLTNGTSYTFTVTATNSAGTSAASTASSAVTPATVPGAPTAAAATGGNTQATVTWTAPASTGGTSITDYTVTSSPGGLTASSASSPATVTGLTNGTAYTFTVTATNAVGTGSASTASSAVTPATTPGTPGTPVATGGDTQASLTWTAPASSGGSAVTGYRITTSPGGATTDVGNVLSGNVTGLSNGTAYTFTVKALNAVGYGSASAASNSVTPAAAGGAPTPPTTTGLLAFYDARYVNGAGGSAPAEGAAVATWTDLSGNGRDATQATADLRPVYRSTASANLLKPGQAACVTAFPTSGVINATAGIDTTVYKSAGASTSLFVSANGDTGLEADVVTGITPGSTYTGRASINAGATGRSGRVSIRWLDASDAVLSTSSSSDTALTASSWVNLSVVAAAPASAAKAILVTTILSAVSGESHYIDERGLFTGSGTAWVLPVDLYAGKPALGFTGGSGGGVRLETASLAGPNPVTVYAVVNHSLPSTDSYTRTVVNHRQASTAAAFYLSKAGANYRMQYRGASATQTSGLLSAPAGPVVLSGVVTDNAKLYRNGAASTASPTSTATPGTYNIRIGAGGAGAAVQDAWAGSICAVLVYAAAHDDTTRQSVESWLNTEWGGIY